MNLETAILILDPETSREALLPYAYDPKRREKVMREACRVVVNALKTRFGGEKMVPLTLEQLRWMDGRPVFVEIKDKSAFRGHVTGGWTICNPELLFMMYVKHNYGMSWLAYAYPPAHIDREAFCGSWEGEADGYADGELVYDVWRCSGCGHVEETDDSDLLPDFCPDCGLALTEKARDILEKRLRG